MVTITPDSSPYFFSQASRMARFDALEDDVAVDVLLVVHLIHDTQEVGTFHLTFFLQQTVCSELSSQYRITFS